MPALAGTFVSLLLLSASASAAPVTVNLRVEGSSTTLFEGPIAAEPQMFETASSKVMHPCNYSENGNSELEFADGGTSSGTPTTALRAAALSSGLAFDAKWFGNEKQGGNPGDFLITRVGTDENENKAPFASWGFAVNETTSAVGGCQIALVPGSEVLWAYNYFNLPHRLRLSGPASAGIDMPFAVHVIDGQTGEPLSGASIGQLVSGVTTAIPSSSTTDASGNATVALAHTGVSTLKATQAESVRSNGLTVCVHNGNDGTCGTTVTGGGPGKSSTTQTPQITVSDVAKVAGVKNGHVYSRRRAPRVLGGIVKVPAGGTLRQVRISLERRYHGRCWDFSGSRVRFVRARKCGSASFFSVGGSESFSYLLPARLPKGRYVFDIEGVDSAGHVTKLVSGVSHVVFQVR
ncbi:MAG: Ig-like domain-containing protein [Solirubrobacterales bacterium]